MDTQNVQKNWADIKAKIKSKWSKIGDTEIDGFKDNLDKLAAQIQKTYGIAKSQAEIEFNEFKKSLHSESAPSRVGVTLTIETKKGSKV